MYGVTSVKIHILANDRAKPGMLAEYGLSLFIQHESANILFDTGQSFVYCRNAGIMGAKLEMTDCIVISHGHFDHCGGLVHFPKTVRCPRVYIHPDAFVKRVRKVIAATEEIGIPWTIQDLDCLGKKLFACDQNQTLYKGIHLLGNIPRIMEFEATPDCFYLEQDGKMMQDPVSDEQILVCETGKGLAVFLGCSHFGVVNCLKCVEQCFPDQAVYALVGGLHLMNASPLRLQLTIRYMQKKGIPKILPLHCTGTHAVNELKKVFGERCLDARAGDVIEI